MTDVWAATPADADIENGKLVQRQEWELRGRVNGGRSTERLADVLRERGVPQQLADRKLTDFLDMRAYVEPVRVARAMLFDEGDVEITGYGGYSGIVLAGAPSTGKTSFGVAMLRAAAWSLQSVKFMTFEMFSKFHTSWIELSQNAGRYDDYAERADEWKTAYWRLLRVYDWLVLDDILRAKVPDFVLDEVHLLVRERTAAGKRTILTMNEPMEKVRHAFPSLGAFIDREYARHSFVAATVLAGPNAR